MKCLYNIEDIRTGKVLYKGLCAKDVNKAIGISRNCVYPYADKGLVYNKMYLIRNVGTAKSIKGNFTLEWERITDALMEHSAIIRNIRIVPKV